MLGIITETGPGSGAPSVDVIGLGGTTLAKTGLSNDSLAALACGPRGAYFTSGDQLMLLDIHGTVSTVGTVAVPPTVNAGSFQLGTGLDQLAIAPLGNEWAYVTANAGANSVPIAQIWLGGPNRVPRPLLNTTETASSLPAEFPNGFSYAVLGWDRDGLVVAETPVGVGGAGPFLDCNVDVFSVNPTTAAETSIANVANCPLSGFTAAGGYACARQATPGNGTQSVEVGLPGAQVRSFALPSGTLAGNVVFDPKSARVAYGQVNLNCTGCSATIAAEFAAIQMEVAPIGGSPHQVGPVGLDPAAWLRDGEIAATQYSIGSDGQSLNSALVLVSPSGAINILASNLDPEFIGLATS